MPPHRTVSFGQPTDFDQIWSIINKADPKENSYWAPPDIREALETGTFLFDRKSGGVLQFYPTKKPPLRVTVYNLFVPKESRGRGIGRDLMYTVRDRFPDRPLVVRCPEGIPSNEFYRRLGLQFQKRIPPGPRGKRYLNLYIWEPLVEAQEEVSQPSPSVGSFDPDIPSHVPTITSVKRFYGNP